MGGGGMRRLFAAPVTLKVPSVKTWLKANHDWGNKKVYEHGCLH